jgi:protein-S-isoprenylcysteine O-methyltransferase Ste14
MTNQLEEVFELINESLVCLGSGVFGVFNMITRGSLPEVLTYAGITTATAALILYYINARELRKVDANKIVLITGCDSGLG